VSQNVHNLRAQAAEFRRVSSEVSSSELRERLLQLAWQCDNLAADHQHAAAVLSGEPLSPDTLRRTTRRTALSSEIGRQFGNSTQMAIQPRAQPSTFVLA